MIRIYFILFISFTLLTSFAGSVALSEKKATPTAEKAKVQWLSMEEAVALQKKQPRKIVVDVYTDWCGWCKKMDKATYADPAVVAYLNKNYYAVKLNAESKNDIVLNGHTYKYKPEYKAHELAVALLQGQLSFPATVYLDEKMSMLAPPVPGYLDASTFTKISRYFGDNHYKTTSWEKFQKLK